MTVTLTCKEALRGEITVPGDKSLSHRAVILGALAEGETEISGFLAGRDCLSTVNCLRQLGVPVVTAEDRVIVKGVGLEGLREPAGILDCGNSGTTARLLLGVLAGQPFFSVITGDESLRRRPMGRVTRPLVQMGACIAGRAQGRFLPLAVAGGRLRPVFHRTPVASAQLKSALLLAGLFASGETVVSEPEKSRDHTERMLAAFGAKVACEGTTVTIEGRPRLKGQKVNIPGDISSAAFFLVAAAITPGSEVVVREVGVNPTRAGIIDVLKEMGAELEIGGVRVESGEPVADIRVRYSELAGTEISGSLIPRLIDELPVLAVAALFARGKTVIKDARELRVKETDRIAAVAEEVAKLGGRIVPTADGMIIEGMQALAGGTVSARGDHRMAMSLAVAALRAEGPVAITESECTDISYPGFWQDLAGLQKGAAG